VYITPKFLSAGNGIGIYRLQSGIQINGLKALANFVVKTNDIAGLFMIQVGCGGGRGLGGVGDEK
jgi:hypothetical protein